MRAGRTLNPLSRIDDMAIHSCGTIQEAMANRRAQEECCKLRYALTPRTPTSLFPSVAGGRRTSGLCQLLSRRPWRMVQLRNVRVVPQTFPSRCSAEVASYKQQLLDERLSAANKVSRVTARSCFVTAAHSPAGLSVSLCAGVCRISTSRVKVGWCKRRKGIFGLKVSWPLW